MLHLLIVVGMYLCLFAVGFNSLYSKSRNAKLERFKLAHINRF